MAYTDNVEITEESYVPGGFGVEDYLIPNKPHIDWGTGVSYAGGFSMPQSNNSGNNFAGEETTTTRKPTADDVNLDGIQSVRKRRSGFANAMMTVADLLKISASMPNAFGDSALKPGSAYLGMTEEEANRRAKARMEEDPEGHQADINRAKILSQRAYETDDPELKKKYGAAIKRLLPYETQGLDDLTASGFYTGNEKMEIERLKAATRLAQEKLKGDYSLQKQGMQGENRIDVANLNNASREQIAEARNATQREIADLNNATKEAIADGKNQTALALSVQKADATRDLHILDNEARYRQAEMQQQHADWRTVYGQDAATDRTNIQQGGANYRANLAAESAERRVAMQQEGAMARVKEQQAGALERARIMQDGALERAKITAAKKGEAPQKATAFEMKVSPDALRKMKQLNSNAGRWETNKYDQSNPDQGFWTRQLITSKDFGVDRFNNKQETRDYIEFEGLAKQIVQDQLKKIYGSQFTEKEGERFFTSMGLSPLVDEGTRWTLFMNAINDLRVKNGYAPIDPEGLVEMSGVSESAPSQQAPQQQSNGVQHVNGRRVF